MMNPSVVAYPEDEEDVVLAIKYATSPEFAEARKPQANPAGYPFKVMGRGGGHQYCGVSCDNDAFIMSMDRFDKTEWVYFDAPKTGTGPEGKPQTITKELHVGTGNKLKEFATFMNTDPKTNRPARGRGRNRDSFGATIPHGECPAVGIGGHSQTGGYGHIARAFGCAVDYIYGCTIVTANGEIRTVNKDSTDQADKDIYWAVLGGSPGAFGVTTNLVIHPIFDEDYPHSTAYSVIYLYNRRRMRATLDILEDFINRSNESDENSISENLDLMTSLSSNIGNRLNNRLNQDRDNFLPNRLKGMQIFQVECKDISDEKAKKQFDEIVEKFEQTVRRGTSPLLKLGLRDSPTHDGKSHYKLSELSLDFVRKPPMVTANGRENRKPYRKMCYGSKEKLKPGWAEAYSDLLPSLFITTIFLQFSIYTSQERRRLQFFRFLFSGWPRIHFLSGKFSTYCSCDRPNAVGNCAWF
jgi:hypothetical protein